MKFLSLLALVLALSNCSSVGQYYLIPAGQSQLTINLDRSDYEIIAEVEGYGEGKTYEQARDASLLKNCRVNPGKFDPLMD